jgi:hypothetical protein
MGFGSYPRETGTDVSLLEAELVTLQYHWPIPTNSISEMWSWTLRFDGSDNPASDWQQGGKCGSSAAPLRPQATQMKRSV